MAKLIERRLTPEEFLGELEKMAYGEGALVVMRISQWKQIAEAYHSPLVKRIADNIIQVLPERAYPGKELGFMVFRREEK